MKQKRYEPLRISSLDLVDKDVFEKALKETNMLRNMTYMFDHESSVESTLPNFKEKTVRFKVNFRVSPVISPQICIDVPIFGEKDLPRSPALLRENIIQLVTDSHVGSMDWANLRKRTQRTIKDSREWSFTIINHFLQSERKGVEPIVSFFKENEARFVSEFKSWDKDRRRDNLKRYVGVCLDQGYSVEEIGRWVNESIVKSVLKR